MTRKRHKTNTNEQENLKRFRFEIKHLSDPSTGEVGHFQHAKSEFSPHGKVKVTRKLKRKEERKMKKARRLAYNERKPMPKVDEQKEQKKKEEIVEQKKKKLEKLKKKKKKLNARKKEKLKEEEEIKKAAMYAAIQREEKMLKQLEKDLHLNKRKSKNLPQSFISDGLDYLLDVVDKEKVSSLYDVSDTEEDMFDKSDNKDESNSDQDISEEEYDENVDEDSDDDELKKQTIDEIMSHLKKSGSKLSGEQLNKTSVEKSNSILKTSKKDKKGNKKVKFKEMEEDENESDENSFSDNMSEDSINNDEGDNSESDDNTFMDDEMSDDDNLDEDYDSESDEFDESENSERGEHGQQKKIKHSHVNKKSKDHTDTEEDKSELIKKSKQISESSELNEDIYGRLRDSEGNIVTKATGSYVPPAKRLAMAETMDEKKRLKVERLKKQIKGLINRASDANMGPICSQIETIYTTNSRGDVNECLCDIIMEACISTVLTPERLAMELMMLLAILNNNIGMEVGGLFIQTLAQKFKEFWENMADKYLDNVVLLFSHLYNFKVFHCILIFDIIKKFTERFTEKDIELILLLLKNVGFSLRKDDPHTLKDIILLIQGKASHVDTTNSTRVKFMLEVLLAIKNNNMRKIPNFDSEQLEQMKKSARSHLKGSLGNNQLRISLEDLMNAEDKGRWWVVGSAWEGRSDKPEDPAEKVQTTIVGETSAKILELARKQRMNTGIRKSIFCILMGSEDYVDAFEKLLRLGLKNQQEREIIHVITDCCIQEKVYNPFYTFLLQKFCEFDRKFQITYQFLLWDKFREMNQQSEQSRSHLGKLTSHLIATKAMSLSVFKVVEFGTLDKNMVRFLKQVLQEILLDYPDQVVQEVFSRIAPYTKLHLLHEGLKLFMRHFLIGKKVKQDQNNLLIERVSLAEKALSSAESKFEL